MGQEEVKVLVPTAMLGYGFPLKWFKEGMKRNPDIIAVDSGSTDSGPHKLGLGEMTCTREAYYKDISNIMEAAQEKKIPVYISSAGGDGTNIHVDLFLDIVKSIAREKGYKLNIAAIYSEFEKEYLKEKLAAGKITPLGPVEPLVESEIDAATSIVGQMGVEPFLRVLEERNDIDIIISGRAYDPVPMAAMCLKKGFDPGICWHMGKIIECGALCAEPAGKVMLGTARQDHFILEPLNPAERCTTYSVAAHTLYEKTHPYLLPGPGGVTDLSKAKFEQFDERRVKVSGSEFVPSERYTVKLEGAKKVGYRYIFIAGIRDPIAISQIDDIIQRVKVDVAEYFREIPKEDYQMIFHVYGKDGVMGQYEIEKDNIPMELCIILEVAAQTQNIATAVCSRARTEILHAPYKGRIATAGNIALPFTPLEIPLGDVCQFNVYHLMEVDDPVGIFPIKYLEV